MCDREVFAGEAVEKFAGQRFAGGEADRMDQNIEAVPVLAEIGEQLRDLRIAGHIARQDDIRAEVLRGFVDARPELVVDIGEGEFGALAVHRFRDAPGDRAVAQNAGDQRAFALQKSHVFSVIACVAPF